MTVRVELIPADAAVELRRAVLRPQFPADVPMPAFAPPDALHLGALDDDGAVIGTCAIFPEPYPTDPDRAGTWQLRGMATDPSHQGGGVGSAVLARADAEMLARGGSLLWCNARLTAIGFYERNGWVVEGDVFASGPAGLPHRRMSREPFVAATSS